MTLGEVIQRKRRGTFIGWYIRYQDGKGNKPRRRDIAQARDKLIQRYDPNTVRVALHPLGAARTWAVQQDLIAQSPMFKIIGPRLEDTEHRLTTKEAMTLCKAGGPHASKSAAIHSLFSGVRCARRIPIKVRISVGFSATYCRRLHAAFV